jgi:hypothetical protein
MAEREREIENRAMSNEERIREEGEDRDRPGLTHDNLDIGTGLGGGVAPVLPTDIDGQNPDSDWAATTDQDMAMPNWTKADELEPGLARMEPQREPLNLPRDTHIVTVFGEDMGPIKEVYGYTPSSDPHWVAIKEGDRRVLVPVMSGQLDDDGLHVPYPKDLIQTSPELPENFSLADEMSLYAHYNERRILPAVDGYTQEKERIMRPLRNAA